MDWARQDVHRIRAKQTTQGKLMDNQTKAGLAQIRMSLAVSYAASFAMLLVVVVLVFPCH